VVITAASEVADIVIYFHISNSRLISFFEQLPWSNQLPLHSSIVPSIMPAVNVLKFPTSSPSDIGPLQKLQNAGYDSSQILGVIGKTEGIEYYRSNFLLLPSVSESPPSICSSIYSLYSYITRLADGALRWSSSHCS
jgi:hypothetical protein